MSGYTKVDNWLFDNVMPHASANTFKLVSAVVRQTAGWRREWDIISLTQFQDLMGSSRVTVIGAIDDAISHGWIVRQKVGQGYRYRITTSTESVPATSTDSIPTSTETILATSTDSIPLTSTDSVPTKENSKDIVKELSDYFTEQTGLMPNLGVYDANWKAPLETMLKRAGSFEQTKDLINRSIAFARDGPKQYRLTSPRSILTIAANMSLNGQSEEVIKVGSR